jgi:RHS repeat-associated protein
MRYAWRRHCGWRWPAGGFPRLCTSTTVHPFVSRQLLRACAVLGIRLVHSAPGQPEGRGKIERFFRTVRDQFLVEIQAQPVVEVISSTQGFRPGSVVALTEGGGNVVNRYVYDPYGNPLAGTVEAVVNPWQFAGGLRDAFSGYIKFGERYYDPSIGRWTQRDPSGQDANSYGYAGANPVNFVDLTGLAWWNCRLDGRRRHDGGLYRSGSSSDRRLCRCLWICNLCSERRGECVLHIQGLYQGCMEDRRVRIESGLCGAIRWYLSR